MTSCSWKFKQLVQNINVIWDGNINSKLLHCIVSYAMINTDTNEFKSDNKRTLVHFTQPIENNDIEQAVNCLKKKYMEFILETDANDNLNDIEKILNKIRRTEEDNKFNEYKSSIKNNIKCKEFIEKHPDLSKELNELIDKFCIFQHYDNNLNDDFYFENRYYPTRGDWNIDDNNGGFSWDQAREQMGTTNYKLSLTDEPIYIENIPLYAKLFQDIGFSVILITYESYRLGYDYDIKEFDEKEYELVKDTAEYIHVCLI